MSDSKPRYSLCCAVIEGQDIYLEVDHQAWPAPGDFVAALEANHIRIHKWSSGFSLPFDGVVHRYLDYFEYHNWGADTQKRVEASAKLLPKASKKKKRTERNPFPRWLAA